jgi:hypothetical protein
VLSFLGAAHQTLVAISGVSDMGSSDDADTLAVLPDWWKAYSVMTWVLAVFVAVALIVGGVQLLRKRMYARWLIVGACAVVIAIELVGIVILADLGDRITKGVKGASSVMVSQITGMGTAVLLVLMIFPVVTILLTLLPPTKRWCLQRAD